MIAEERWPLLAARAEKTENLQMADTAARRQQLTGHSARRKLPASDKSIASVRQSRAPNGLRCPVRRPR